jgi:hypothetical protein
VRFSFPHEILFLFFHVAMKTVVFFEKLKYFLRFVLFDEIPHTRIIKTMKNYQSHRSMVNKFKKNKGQKRKCGDKFAVSKKYKHEMKNAVQRIRQSKFYENVYRHHEESDLWREQEKAENGWNNWTGWNYESDIGWGVDEPRYVENQKWNGWVYSMENVWNVDDGYDEFRISFSSFPPTPSQEILQSKESILCAQRLLLPLPSPMVRLTNDHEVPSYVSSPLLNELAFVGCGSYSLFGLK